MTIADAQVEPRRRLHPLTPLLRSFRMLALAVAAISWQGYSQLGTRRWLVALVLVAAATAAYSLIAWYMTGFQIVQRELRVYDGVLSRRTRAIPLERVQSIELVQPALARLFGLAELRLEVVGGSRTEAPLAYLPAGDAAALRDHLLSVSRGAGATVETAAPAATPESVVHTVADRDLIVSQLLRPQVWAVPVAVAGIVVSFVMDRQAGLIGIAALLTAVVGAVLAPIRQVLGDWRFTVGDSVDGLRIRRGLLERRHQTVPPGRVQAVGVQWPLLWRAQGWVRARMDVAGVGKPGDEATREGTLLPVGTVPTARLVVAHALPGFDLTAIALRPVPRAAHWLAPLRRFVLGYTLTEKGFVVRYGLLTRTLVVVPYARIQSVRVRQGPVQRLLGLATVHADTAGGSLSAVAEHRDAAEARALAEELAEQSRAARRAAAGPGDPRP